MLTHSHTHTHKHTDANHLHIDAANCDEICFVHMTGDRLLEVDGSNLRGVTHQQAVECLKRSGEVLMNRFTHRPSYTQPTPRTDVSVETTLSGRAKDYNFVTDENTHEVVLKKSLSGLGFSFYISQLRSGADRGSVVRIKRLFPGQPAQESGLLREGDVILSVNREPVKDLSYQRVLFLLRGAPSEVRLLICRPPPGVLYEVNDNTLVTHSGSDQVQERQLWVHHHPQQAGQLLLHTGDPGQPRQGRWATQGRGQAHHGAHPSAHLKVSF
uniref:PDZ domain-containing protein n=1 Tax=Fundulus heteroclitus TaxID=8078 RepID=A0A3Q2NWM9_FUNHE